MSLLTKSVRVKQWLSFVMILLSGFAIGDIIARLSAMLGL
jgi:hypothetical protein